MAGENPPKNPTENPSASAWEEMEPHTEKDAEYYRSHPNEIGDFVQELIKLRGGAESIKRGATWDKEQRAHVDPDGTPRDWAHLVGYLKRNPDQIDRFVEEYNSLKGGDDAVEEPAAAEGGTGESDKPVEENPVEEEKPAESEKPAEGEPSGEGAEAAEAEMTHEQLVHEVYDYCSADVFTAAETLGFDLNDDVSNFEKMSDEDILGELQNSFEKSKSTYPNPISDETTAPAEGGDGGKTTTPEDDGGDKTTSEGGDDNKGTAEGGDDGKTTSEGGDDNKGTAEGGDGSTGAEKGAEADEDRETQRKKRIGRRMMEFVSRNRNKFIIGGLVSLLVLFGSLATKNNGGDNYVDTSDAMTDTESDEDAAENQAFEEMAREAAEDADDASEDEEAAEAYEGIIDGYGEYGLWTSESKTGDHDFGYAAEIAEEEGCGSNDAKNQSESFADYVHAMPDAARPASLRGITDHKAMEAAIEAMSPEEYEEAYASFEESIMRAEVVDTVLNGDYMEAHMRLRDPSGPLTHENMELELVGTSEHNTPVQEIRCFDEEGNFLGSFIVKANTDETRASGEIGDMHTVHVGRRAPTPESTPDPTPEPTPDPTPEPTPDPTPEPTPDPTPEPTPDPTPEPTPDPTPEPTPDPTPEPLPEKDPEEIEENMGVTPDESTNVVTPMDSTENDTARPETPAAGTEGAYNPAEQTFGSPSAPEGAGDSDGDHAVDQSSEQVGAQDISLESADGSGQTIQETVEQADTSSQTDQGQAVAEQENRTEDDQQRQEVREEAHEAEQQTVTEQASGQEAAAQTEEQHQDATPEELQQEGADAFASGDF